MGDLTKNFSRSEFACKCGCGYDDIDLYLVKHLQFIRENTGSVAITSGCRCEAHNAAVGGVRGSAHTNGLAADIACDNGALRRSIVGAAVQVVDRIGVAKNFVHIDVDQDKPRSLWVY